MIEQKLSGYSPELRARLQAVHDLIMDVAHTTDGVGNIAVSLKWGQLSFATVRPKSGTPLRIDGRDGAYSLYVPCSTDLIARFQAVQPHLFEYHGKREIRLSLDAPLPEPTLRAFIEAALTYYL